MQNQEEIKKKLIELKQNVTQQMNSIDKHIRHEGMSSDWAEQATERENDEVLESLGNTAAQKLAKINAALQRIESGEYFHCSVCGDEIPAARLELLPFSSLCVNCADKLETQR